MSRDIDYVKTVILDFPETFTSFEAKSYAHELAGMDSRFKGGHIDYKLDVSESTNRTLLEVKYLCVTTSHDDD